MRGHDLIFKTPFATNNMTTTLDFLTQLKTDAWRTAGARFNATRRLEKRDTFATFSIALFSALSVGIAIYPKVYDTASGSAVDNYLTIMSVALGLFIIVISLIEWGMSNGKKADALRQNADKLNAFHREVGQKIAETSAGEIVETEVITELRNTFQSIKSGCPYNHEPIDDALFISNHRHSEEFKRKNGKSNMGLFTSGLVRIKAFLASVWYFSIFWLAILLLLFVTYKQLPLAT